MNDDRLLSLFSADEPSGEIEKLVSNGLRSFLSSVSTTGGLDAETLASQFASTDIPNGGMPTHAYLEDMFENVIPHTVRTHHRQFIGHMTSALPTFVDPLSRIMTTLNQNVVKLETSEAFTFLERQALGMIHRLVYGLPAGFYDQHVQNAESTLAMLVSGGTLANVSALWCARNASLPAKGSFRGVGLDGVIAGLRAHEFDDAVIIGSSLMHYSLRKAADLLGIGEKGLMSLPADHDGRLVLSDLKDALATCKARRTCVLAVVGIAGATETGTIDRLPEIAELAREYGVRFHVDAAWGGPVVFSKKYRDLLKGIELADSVAIDGHKQLYLPMGIGMVLLRDPSAAAAIEKTANYIVRRGSVDLGRRTLEGSRPAMAIFLHGALKIIGADGYERLIDGGIERAKYLGSAIEKRADFELTSTPELNILTYRYLPSWAAAAKSGTVIPEMNERINEVNRKIHAEQWSTGTSFISRTVLPHTRHGAEPPIVVLRAVLANPLTRPEDIDAVIAEQATIGAKHAG